MLRFQVSIYGGFGEKALTVTFDWATTALQLLERLFIEPDGSFVWVGAAAEGEPWQVDGELIDRGDALAYVKLKGRCPEEQFDRLLAAFGWPQATLAFQLPRRGATLDKSDFVELAASEAGAV
jgi:hypothetical protein